MTTRHSESLGSFFVRPPRGGGGRGTSPRHLSVALVAGSNHAALFSGRGCRLARILAQSWAWPGPTPARAGMPESTAFAQPSAPGIVVVRALPPATAAWTTPTSCRTAPVSHGTGRYRRRAHMSHRGICRAAPRSWRTAWYADLHIYATTEPERYLPTFGRALSITRSGCLPATMRALLARICGVVVDVQWPVVSSPGPLLSAGPIAGWGPRTFTTTRALGRWVSPTSPDRRRGRRTGRLMRRSEGDRIGDRWRT